MVGEVRRLEGGVGVVSVELGDDGGDRGDSDGSLVSCSSGKQRSSSGATSSGFLGIEGMSKRCGTKRGFR